MGCKNFDKYPVLLFLAVLGACLISGSNALAITANSYLTTADPLATTSCQAPTAKTAFSPTDSVVYLWASVSNAAIGDTVEWRWFSPDNALYNTSTYTFDFQSATACTWGGIFISGQPAATLTGTWKVELYLNGSLAATANFAIGNVQQPLAAPMNLRFTLSGKNLTIAWDPVTGATGYKLGYGVQSGSYSSTYDAGNITQVGPFDVSTVVAAGTYYVAARAYNGTQESSYSNEITVTVTDRRTDRGAVFLQLNSENYSPGSLLDIRYETKKGTLQGNVDIYFAVRYPQGDLVFITTTGAADGPLFGNVAITDGITPLFSSSFPEDLPFGNYIVYMYLVYAGADAADQLNWASGASQADISYTPLSAEQQSVIQSQGGNPDFLSLFWIDELQQKREAWLYMSATPTSFVFVNGNLESQEAATDVTGGPGPRVDPGVFTPQTTLDQLTAAFGPPTTVAPVEGLPEYQSVVYSSGIYVILRNGRLITATTSAP